MSTTLHTLSPGAKGADFVALTDRVKDWLLANQVEFVLRYVVPENYTRIGKDYRAWETDWYAEHGICPISNFERHATDAEGGASAGYANGRAAADLTTQFGFPVSAPIFCSVDQGISPGSWLLDIAEDYVRAFAAAIAPYPLGIYGGDVIADRVRDLNPVFWKAAASSWSRGLYEVDIQQHFQVEGFIDPNTVRKPLTVWDPSGTRTPIQEDDMPARIVYVLPPAERPDGAHFITTGGPWRYAVGGDKAWAEANGGVVVREDVERYDLIVRSVFPETVVNVPAPVVNVPAPVVNVPALELPAGKIIWS